MTKALMTQWANEHLSSGKTFGRGEPVKWFAEHYPKLKSTTIRMHVDGMSVNVINRRHHPSIRPGSGHDLFYKLGSDSYRLWDPQNDPQPLYKENIEALGVAPSNNISSEDEESVQDGNEGGSEFAFEKDLQNSKESSFDRAGSPSLRGRRPHRSPVFSRRSVHRHSCSGS
jgi:endonuclease